MDVFTYKCVYMQRPDTNVQCITVCVSCLCVIERQREKDTERDREREKEMIA